MHIPKVAGKVSHAWSVKSAEEKALILDKRQSTCRTSFGVDNPAKSLSVKAKTRATIDERYGNRDAYFESRQRATEETFLANYGFKCSFQAESVKNKIQKACVARYGYKHHAHSPDYWKQQKGKIHQRKYVELADGHELVLQGYEGHVALGLDSNGLLVDKPEVSIPYLDPTTKRQRYYHPDLFAVNPSSGSNYLIEVKSRYTLKSDLSVNLAKFRAANRLCRRLGVVFTLCMCEGASLLKRIDFPTQGKLHEFI